MPRYFFLTTSRTDNIQTSAMTGGWCCQGQVAAKLSEALARADAVLCCVAARPTGRFSGLARLASPPMPGQVINWAGDNDVGPPMAVQWIYKVDMPFQEAEQLR